MLGEYFPDRPGFADTLSTFYHICAEKNGKMPQRKIVFLLLGKLVDGWVAMAVEPVLGQLNKYQRIGLATSTSVPSGMNE